MLAGTAAFWGALIVGERQSKVRARDNPKAAPKLTKKVKRELSQPGADFSLIAANTYGASSDDLIPNNNTYIVLGTLIVVTGYIFFTGGRTLGQSGIDRTNASSKIIQNTLISAAFGGLVSFVLKTIVLRRNSRAAKYDCLTLCNGILIGLISVAGAADRVQNWGAVLIGSIAGFWYVGGILYLEFWRIDDPLEVFPVHGLGGLWGLFAVGFFDNNRGALYDDALKQGRFMGYQIVGIVVIIAWTSLFSILGFLIMRKLHILRIDPAIEEIGLDVAELGNVPEEYIDAVREQLKKRDAQAKVEQMDQEEAETENDKEAEVEVQDHSKKEVELKGIAYIF